MIRNHIFYSIKPYIPRRIQILLRSQLAKYKRKKYSHTWPINPAAIDSPAGWKGWPENKRFALVLSHDVDTHKGHDNVLKLVDVEKKLGFVSSFNFVPERYNVSPKLREDLVNMGFEICVHGLKHDGKLFRSRKIFKKRAMKINNYLREWRVDGFTAPSMISNPVWLHDLNSTHSISSFDTDPFEPQPNAVNTIFPLWVQNGTSPEGYVEIPYTLPQDHLLFIVLKEQNIEIWKRKLDWIAQNGGMALLNSHPDYMNFENKKCSFEEYPVRIYKEFLLYAREKYEGEYWHVLPKDLSQFWINNF